MSTKGFGSAMRSGVFWSTAAFVAGRLLSLVAMVILARILVPAEFGILAAIVVYVGLIELVSDLGMRAAVVYEQDTAKGELLDSAFTINLVLAILLSALGVALAPVVADLFQVPAAADLFRLAAINPLIVAMGNIHDAVLLRDLQFRRRAIPQIIRAFVRGALSIALAVAGFGAAALVIGLLAGSLAWSISLWIVSTYGPRLKLAVRGVGRMISYGLGAAALELLAVATTRVDVVVIGAIIGPAALGLYTVAYRIPELILESVAWNVSAVAFPALSRERVASEHTGVGDGTIALLRYQALFALPVAAALALLAPALMVVVFSPRWAAAGGVAAAVAILFGISACLFPLGDAFKALGRQRILVAINVAFLPVLAGSIIAAAPLGIEAVAWVRVASQALFGAVVLIAAAKVLSVRTLRIGSALLPGALAAAVVGGGVELTRILVPGDGMVALMAGALVAVACFAGAVRLVMPDLARRAGSVLRTRRRPLRVALGGPL